MKMKILVLFLPLLVFLILAGSLGYSQYPAISSHPDTTNYPYWYEMMQDPNANFYATQSAFKKYWRNRPVTPGNGWKIFKRWEYINESRVQADGKLPAPDYVMQQYNKYNKTHEQKSQSGSWTQIGPVGLPTNIAGQPPGLGRINAIGFHPFDANTFYVGSPSGGFWKTSDGGATWMTLSAALPTLGVSAILLHPTTSNTIWIGTGDRDAADAPGMGVFKSTDGGITWNVSNTGMGNKTVGMLLVHPANPNIILAATSGGIYKSTDGGANWTLKSYNTGSYKDIQFKPGDPTIIYATEGGNFYRSTDTGDTWTQISIAIAGNRLVIGVSPNNPSYVYIVQTNGPFAGLLRSTNSGLNFTTQCTTPNIMDRSCDGSTTATQAVYDLCIAVDPNNAETLWVGGINIWKSTNGGVTWTINTHWVGSCSVPAVHADIHVLAWSPLNGKLFTGNDGGIYYTSNGGTNWTDISSGLAIAQPYKLGQSATSEPLVINGYQDNGTATNYGSTFTTVIGGDGMECLIDYSDTNYRYGEVYYGTIFRSTGSNYLIIAGNTYNGINESGYWVTPYMLHRTDPNTMFIGYNNIWRSNNIKAPLNITFTPISAGETSYCRVLEQSPANLNILYVSRGTQLKRTSNANAAAPAWTTCTSPSSSYITDIEAHPTDSSIVYATAGYCVYKSTDRGMTWTNISGTLPAVSINCLVYDKNSNEGIYIGTRTGVYYKDATLSDWVAFGTGLPVVDVRELEIYYGTSWFTSKIKAATYGRGLWQSDLIETGVLNPTNFAATPVSGTEIDLNWVKNPNNNNVMVAYNTNPALGTPVNGNSYLQGTGIPGGGTVIYNGSATSFNHTSLISNTSYYYKIWSYDGSLQYSIGAIASATSLCTLVTAYPWIEGFENAGNIPSCWTQEYVSSTTNWVFQNGGHGAHPSAAHTGSYNATLYINNTTTHPVTKLISLPLNLTGITNPVLRFWHTQEVWAGRQDELRVYYRTSPTGTWNLLATYTSNIATWTQESIQLPYPSAIYYVAFEGTANHGYGVCVDDIAVTTNSLTWNGMGNWSVNTNWNPPFVPAAFDNANIDSGTCTVNTNVTCGSITVKPGATLSIDPSRILTVLGNLTIIN